jgi:hypothetical protein
MSFCTDSNEFDEQIEECRNGEITETELLMWTLSAMTYKCDMPEAHGNCYEDRCLIFAQSVFDFFAGEFRILNKVSYKISCVLD